MLAAGEHAVVVSNEAAFEERYGAGINVIGEYSDQLSNDGEQILLRDAVGENILKFTYDDRWYPATDGDGYALVILDDTADWSTWDLATSWGIGEPVHGSPGAQNSTVILQQYEGWLNQHFSETEIDDPLISATRRRSQRRRAFQLPPLRLRHRSACNRPPGQSAADHHCRRNHARAHLSLPRSGARSRVRRRTVERPEFVVRNRSRSSGGRE